MVKMELHVFAETPPTASPPPNFPAHFPQLGQDICHFTPVLPVLLSTPLTGAEAHPAPLQLGCPALPRAAGFCTLRHSCSPGEDTAILHPQVLTREATSSTASSSREFPKGQVLITKGMKQGWVLDCPIIFI